MSWAACARDNQTAETPARDRAPKPAGPPRNLAADTARPREPPRRSLHHTNSATRALAAGAGAPAAGIPAGPAWHPGSRFGATFPPTGGGWACSPPLTIEPRPGPLQPEAIPREEGFEVSFGADPGRLLPCLRRFHQEQFPQDFWIGSRVSD